MIVRSFLDWYDEAPMPERIEAVRMMVHCVLSGELGGDTRQEAESALTLVLDDPSISVRAALAWELALSDAAPRHIVLGLAHDVAEVAALVLARSPQLAEADLAECASNGEALTHLAIASRLAVPASVADCLSKAAGVKALTALIENPGAVISDQTFRDILARHEGDGALREALHRRDDLPADVRQSLIAAVSRDLLGFVQQRGWLGNRRAERTIADAREDATVTLASEADDLARFIAHLAGSGQLTPSLLIRSLLTGDTSLFGAALVCLADVAPQRVASMLRGRGGSALAATCARAGLPRALVPVFTAALTAIAEMPRGFVADGQTLQRPIIAHVLRACLMEDVEALQPVLATLRRLDADLARAEARLAIERMKAVQPELLDAVADAIQTPMDDLMPTPEISEIDQPAEQFAVADDALLMDTVASAELFVEQEPVQIPVLAEIAADIEPVLLEHEDAATDMLPALVPVALPDIRADAATEAEPEALPATPPLRIIRRATAAQHAILPDLEALFEQMYRDEIAVSEPLRIVGDGSLDAQFFSGSAQRKTRAA